MSKRIVIAGVGGFGRGVYSWLIQSPDHLKTNNISEIVFIDDSKDASLAPAKVVSSIQDYAPTDSDAVIIAVGSPEIRRRLVEILKQKNVVFHQFIDDRAVIGHGVKIGEGAVICPGVVISAHAAIGDHVHVNFNCSIGHDTVLGNFTTLSPMSNIMGETNVGSDVFVGGSAVILPRLEIASGVTIGAGAVVLRSIKQLEILGGNPARPIRSNRDHRKGRKD